MLYGRTEQHDEPSRIQSRLRPALNPVCIREIAYFHEYGSVFANSSNIIRGRLT